MYKYKEYCEFVCVCTCMCFNYVCIFMVIIGDEIEYLVKFDKLF